MSEKDCEGCGGESLQQAMMGVAADMGRPVPITTTLKFYSIDPRIKARIDTVFAGWLRTPYMDGQRAKGMGADCVNLVVGVLDELCRREKPTKIPRFRGDVGVHSIRHSMTTVLAIRHGFLSDVVRDGTIEPGDIIITRSTHDATGPARLGHVLITGNKPGTALHTTARGPGACYTTLASLTNIMRVYRFRNKRDWI